MKTKYFSEFSDWTLLNYLNFRLKEVSWTADKPKEHIWYKRHLCVLMKDPKLTSKAQSALEAFQVDHSVIPHHNASDISATVDGPNLRSMLATLLTSSRKGGLENIFIFGDLLKLPFRYTTSQRFRYFCNR
ncbi:hypothetical protein F8M41_018585 [Gigaspora margarita]|uniref:Uncharacterized protein n=1 Tax=Gigaspora margarita TaxID=4874 RepID=A0A8H4EL60_GIGMA|nr:hypothetical protein F8M41_018585 [Gigaspora margarita]